MRLAILAPLGALALALLPAAWAQPNQVGCMLAPSAAGFSGQCTVPCLVNALSIDIDGPRPGARCDAPDRAVAATLRPTDRPGHWLGTMQGKFPEDPTRFELIEPSATAPGIAKTPFGWFRLASARIDAQAISLGIDAGRQLPPTQDDIRIIERSLQLLAHEGIWNRQDDRTCRPNPVQWSLFCALTQATQEISGGVHYRQPALQAVREVLNEVGAGRIDRHRLMDYNNHPATTLAEVHTLLRLAEAKVRERFR